MKQAFIILTILFFSTVFNSVQAQQDTATLTILEYGLPPGNDYLNARATVADEWGLRFKRVAGCIVSDSLVDSVKKHNDSVYSQIVNGYGEYWETRFEKEVEKELEVQKKARALIDKQAYIARLDSTLGTEGNGLHYYLTPEQPKTVYSAKVLGYGDLKGETELVTYYELTINLKTRDVKIDSDKIKPFEIE